MSRAFINFKDYERRLKAAFKESFEGEEGAAKYKQVFIPLKDDAIFAMAARLVRFHARMTQDFKEAVISAFKENKIWKGDGIKTLTQSYSDNEIFGAAYSTPLIVFAKNPDLVRVYTNIPIDDFNEEALSTVSFILNWETLKTFQARYKADVASPYSKAWVTPLRAWKRIKRYEEITVAAALAKYTILGKLVTTNVIANVAATIVDVRAPCKLHYVDSPEDAITMYATGPNSCMHNNHATPEKDDNHWIPILFKNKMHPTSFFAFHPHIRGIYSTIGNKVVCRTFLYESEGGKKEYGRVYASNAKLQEKFINTLKQMGYTDIRGPYGRKYARPTIFKIPGALYEGHWYMPMPYCDDISDTIHLAFDAKTHEFTVTTMSRSSVTNVNYQQGRGWVRDDEMTAFSCKSCERIMVPGNDRHIAVDGSHFCSPDCITKANYTLAIRGDGMPVIIPVIEAYVDPLCGRTYTNFEALVSNGGLPYMPNKDIEEEDCITTEGIIIRRYGEYYRASSRANWIKELADSGKLSNNGGFTFPNGRRDSVYDIKDEETPACSVSITYVKSVTLAEEDVLFAA